MYKEIEKIVKESARGLLEEGFFAEIMTPSNPEHGDYSSSAPFKIAKITGGNPMEVAETIVEKIKESKDGRFKKIEGVSPGFINFTLSDSFLKKELLDIIGSGNSYGSNSNGKGRVAIIDYSSPNIAKQFGVGHLRSTIIGQSIYNILKFSGWECVGDNHLGDWGTQFGKLIFQIKKSKLHNEIGELTLGELEELYIAFHKDVKEDPEIEEEGRKWFKKLEDGDKEATRIWQSCVDTSIKEFNIMYDILGVKIDMALGESFYTKMTDDIVEEVKEKGIASESKGALVVKFPDESLPPIILVKSDGATTYLTRDLATIKYRIEKWDPDKIIYEVGSDQLLYFKQVFEIVKLMEWSKKASLVHIAHGLVRWKHGKFSTRKGETVHLEDILDETVRKTREIIERSEIIADISKEEKDEISRVAGIGAVKYNDLSQHYSRDILFDWEKMLNLKGNSSPYVQYTFARANRVVERSGKKEVIDNFESIELSTREEAILRKIRLFPQVIEEAEKMLSPNVICNFLFSLSQSYNAFYSKEKIIKSEKEDFRIAITIAVAQVIKSGLSLLGIGAPEKM